MEPIRRSNRKLTVAQTQKSEAAADEAAADAFAGLEEPDIYQGKGKKCEIHLYEKRYNSRGEQILLQSGCRSELDHGVEISIDAALVLIRYYSMTKELETTQLEIKSPYIKAALKEVVRSYPGVNINSGGPILIPDDPWCLFHYRDELRAYATRLCDKKAKEHVNFCLQYMTKVLQREISSYERLMLNEEIGPGLEFQNLWMAFKPGTLLYQNFEDVDIICRLREMGKRQDTNGPEYWRLYTEMLTCDGKDFRYFFNKVNISHYDGYRPLTALDIFPLAHHPEQKSIRKSLLARGKQYISLFGIHHCMHDGPADVISNNCSGEQFQTQIVQGRVMVDSKEYNDDVHHTKPEFIPDTKIIRPSSGEHLNLCDEDLLICQHRVPAFTLSTKRWGLFDVSNLHPVEYNQEAFSSLILPPDIKKTLSALVQLQEGQTSQFDDLIIGKGKGLIILLHGLPGVGKTFTAESIADYSKRSLYRIGKSDFGNAIFQDPEKGLTTALARASKWNAIVLLDEADVFMQERSASEMFRNEQVSVLLRILEYFEGTMFLTTNRVQTIDPAFKSRIHLSITYPALSAKSRSGLWETFILKGTEQYRPPWLNAKFLDKISREEVNGREIKNVVRVAHALAFSDKRPMQAMDLLQGLQSLKNFERDFNEAAAKRRHDDDQYTTPSKKVKVNDREECNEETEKQIERAYGARSSWKFWS